jgi:hypothetical protein
MRDSRPDSDRYAEQLYFGAAVLPLAADVADAFLEAKGEVPPQDSKKKGFWMLSYFAQDKAKAKYKSVAEWLKAGKERR